MTDRMTQRSGSAELREQWSNVAQGWRSRWAAFERGAQPLSDRMMELAHIAPGQKVLDVATGIGEPAMTAARKAGPSGSVVAIDQAPQMLAVARERMQAAGIHTVEFVEGDAEAVALPPDSFDAVICRWGLMFFHDPVNALARFRNSLVPGGWLAVAIWGEPSRVPIISLDQRLDPARTHGAKHTAFLHVDTLPNTLSETKPLQAKKAHSTSRAMAVS